MSGPNSASVSASGIAPALSLAYPRCLLAGTRGCSLTLSVGNLAPQPGQCIKVFARHQGCFLGSETEEGFRSTLACSELEVPGPGAFSDGGSETELYITLDAPVSAGLITIECEASNLLSNWKPVRGRCSSFWAHAVPHIPPCAPRLLLFISSPSDVPSLPPAAPGGR